MKFASMNYNDTSTLRIDVRHLMRAKNWFRCRTFHVLNLIERVQLWGDTGATSDSDAVPCVKPKLSSTDTVELNAFAAPN